MAVRLPRIGWATEQAAKEATWLPRLAPHLPLALPVQLAMGHPAEGYPFEWSVYEWLPGENANVTIDDLDQAAVDLAAFVKALRRVDTTGAHPRPPHGRGGPLAESDEQVRRSIAQLGDRIDGDDVHGAGANQDLGDVKRLRDIALALDFTHPQRVAADVVGARMLGFNVQAVRHLCEAQRLGVGEADIGKMQFPAMDFEQAFEVFTRAVYGRALPAEYV
jgi:hypothetical protein